MRAALGILATILGSLLLAALLAWPVWILVHALVPEWPFDKVVSRFWQILLLAGLLLTCRLLGLRGREDWGYGLPRPQFLRQAAVGLVAGVATMLPMTIVMFALGIVRLRPEFGPQLLADALVAGLLAGLGVAIGEETFFRGLMYRAVSRESGFAAAAWCTALVYAAIHFLAPAKMPADEVAWDSGLRLLIGALRHFSQPWPIFDSLVTLFLVGLFLALVRRRTGAIATGIGLHVGWVWVMKSTKVATHVNRDAALTFLVSSFDHYTGWLVAGWAALLIAFAWARGWFTAGPATAR